MLTSLPEPTLLPALSSCPELSSFPEHTSFPEHIPSALRCAAVLPLLQYNPDDRPTIDDVLSSKAVRPRMLALMENSWNSMESVELSVQLSMQRAVRRRGWRVRVVEALSMC